MDEMAGTKPLRDIEAPYSSVTSESSVSVHIPGWLFLKFVGKFGEFAEAKIREVIAANYESFSGEAQLKFSGIQLARLEELLGRTVRNSGDALRLIEASVEANKTVTGLNLPLTAEHYRRLEGRAQARRMRNEQYISELVMSAINLEVNL